MFRKPLTRAPRVAGVALVVFSSSAAAAQPAPDDPLGALPYDLAFGAASFIWSTEFSVSADGRFIAYDVRVAPADTESEGIESVALDYVGSDPARLSARLQQEQDRVPEPQDEDTVQWPPEWSDYPRRRPYTPAEMAQDIEDQQALNPAKLTVRDAVNAEYYVALNLGRAIAVWGDARMSLLQLAAYSPGGTKAVFLTRKGNIDGGTMDFSLQLVAFDSTAGAGSFRHDELARLSSNSNRPAISQVRWLSDHEVGFIGEHPGGEPQVMSVDLKGNLRAYSSHPGKKLGFDINAQGTVVFGVIAPPDEEALAEERAFIVGKKDLRRIIGLETIEWRRPTLYYVSHKGGAAERLHSVSNATSNFPPFISVSPSGRYAVVATSPAFVPEDWVGLPLRVKPVADDPVRSLHAELTLVDLEADSSYSLGGRRCRSRWGRITSSGTKRANACSCWISSFRASAYGSCRRLPIGNIQ